MYQAITTKFHGPTDSRGSRYSARCEAGRVTVAADDGLSDHENHKAACLALLRKLGWDSRPFYGGITTDSHGVFVDAAPEARVVPEPPK